MPAGKRPTFKVRVNGPGPGLRPRLQVQEEGQGRAHLPQGRRSAAPRRRTASFQRQAEVLRLPRVLAQLARHLLLAGAPDRLRGRPLRLPPGRADREVPRRGVDPAHDPRPVRIGCSGWNYESWRETFYPPRLPARRWLEHYATQFDTVEVNATFYRLAKPSAVDGWVHHTPHDFVFAVKASRYLTHMKRLTDMDRGVGALLRVDRAAGRVAQARPGPVAAARPLPPRRRPPRARAREPAAGPPRVRAAPPELVRRAGVGAAARARRRVRAPRRPPARRRRPRS